ncbi:MAG: GTA head formation protein, RCAP_rcc01685 family [Shimia sp.]|uniref:GTA head formation protein, RCAP_rcc01685 family n=1 Tax=Shimia sp. TaxID=1954381 RepID=UPI00405881AC
MSEQRYGFEAFDCAPALRLEAHERVAKLQFDSLNRRLDKIETLIERLEKRLWLTVYGVAGVILAQAFQSLMDVTP